MADQYYDHIKSAFNSMADNNNKKGIRPVVFDIIAPDGETSLLPDDLKMVMHVNPSSMSVSYTKVIERTQTLGGYVEQHWGDGSIQITFEMATGGFMRLTSGLSNTTGTGPNNEQVAPSSEKAMDIGGSRRETIAYDKYLDLLSLFHHNGSIYDTRGTLVMQGRLRVMFDGMSWYGWFDSFSVQEEAERPYQFSMSASFTVEKEEHDLRTFAAVSDNWADAIRGSVDVSEDFQISNRARSTLDGQQALVIDSDFGVGGDGDAS